MEMEEEGGGGTGRRRRKKKKRRGRERKRKEDLENALNLESDLWVEIQIPYLLILRTKQIFSLSGLEFLPCDMKNHIIYCQYNK